MAGSSGCDSYVMGFTSIGGSSGRPVQLVHASCALVPDAATTACARFAHLLDGVPRRPSSWPHDTRCCFGTIAPDSSSIGMRLHELTRAPAAARPGPCPDKRSKETPCGGEADDPVVALELAPKTKALGWVREQPV
jgi:hypothetical protein